MKKLLIIGFASVSMSCWAADPGAEMVAKERYAATIDAFGQDNSDCESKADVLPSDALNNSQLAKDQKLVAFQYFYFKAQAECTYKATAEYAVAANSLAQLDNKYLDLVEDSNKLIMANQVEFLKALAAYKKLPASLQKQLSEIPALQNPFKLAESAEAVGLR
jgi:hypothetical protein